MLVELLVVIAIIGILMSMSLPAVQSARELGRKAQCANNIKQLELSLQLHHQAQGRFPPAAGAWDLSGTWLESVLPCIEESAIKLKFCTDLMGFNQASSGCTNQQLPFATCPSDDVALLGGADHCGLVLSQLRMQHRKHGERNPLLWGPQNAPTNAQVFYSFLRGA